MDEGAEQRIDDEDDETSSFQVVEARKRRYVECYNNETIPITGQTTEKMVITPPKEDDKIMMIVETNENTKMDEGGEHRNSDEDSETSSFEDVEISESDGEEARKRRYIEYCNDKTIPITAREKTEKMVITPKKQHITMTVNERYPCKFCTDRLRLFKSETGLQHHIRDKHLEKPTKSAIYTFAGTSMKIVKPNENKKLDEGGEHRNSDEDSETSSFEDVATSESDDDGEDVEKKVEEARKRRYIEYYNNETIPITAQKTKKMVITPPKEDDKIMKIVETNENTKMDEGGEHRNSDEDSETSSFEDVETSESDGEEARKRRYIEYCNDKTIPITAREKTEKMDVETRESDEEEARKRRYIEYCNNETIPITAREKTEKMVITPQKQHTTMTVNERYPCKFCTDRLRLFKSETGLQHHIRDKHLEKPTKLANTSMKIVEPNENTKMDERGEHRNNDEDYETCSFKNVATTEIC